MKKIITITLIFTLILVMVLSFNAFSSPEPKARAAEDVAVYLLLLKEECRSNYEGSPVLILNQTYYDDGFDEQSILRHEPFVSQPALADYREINQEPQILDPTLVANHEFCNLISQEQIDTAVKEDINWYNKHMLISFTRIGFNPRLDRAIVVREYYCGDECAGNDLYILVRDHDTWVIKTVVDGWRS